MGMAKIAGFTPGTLSVLNFSHPTRVSVTPRTKPACRWQPASHARMQVRILKRVLAAITFLKRGVRCHSARVCAPWTTNMTISGLLRQRQLRLQRHPLLS